MPTQKSYSSSETLKAYDHDTRMHYGNRVTDLVHRESDEFPRQGMFRTSVFLFHQPLSQKHTEVFHVPITDLY